jgi:site-specific recombinase XerD
VRRAGDESPGLDAKRVLTRYERWLGRQPLAPRTRDAYLAQVRGYVTWLAGSAHGAAALSEPKVRDWAVRDYKRHVKGAPRRWAPASVNQALAALDNFYRHHLGLGPPQVPREDLPRTAPRSLEVAEQRAFLRAVEVCPSARDRAIATVFFYTGVRLSELAALDVEDVQITNRRGRLTVRSGKGDAYREVPLNSACRAAVNAWLKERTEMLGPAADEEQPSAVWLSRAGRRMTARAVDLVIRRLARDAGLSMSAHTLRHTAVTNLIRSGADVVLVAEIAGHRRLDTVRKYSLPSEADKDAVLEAVLVET